MTNEVTYFKGHYKSFNKFRGKRSFYSYKTYIIQLYSEIRIISQQINYLELIKLSTKHLLTYFYDLILHT